MMDARELINKLLAEGKSIPAIADRVNQVWDDLEADGAGDELQRLYSIAQIVETLKDKGLSCRQIGEGKEATFEWRLTGKRVAVSCNLRVLQRKGELNWQFFAAWGEFTLDLVPEGKWKETLKFLVTTGKMPKVEVADTSIEARIIASTWRWFDHRGEGSEYSDLESGSYIIATNKRKTCFNFLPAPLVRWLHRDLGFPVAEKQVLDALSMVGLMSGRQANQIRVGRNPVVNRPRVWAIPVSTFESYVSRNIVKTTENGAKGGKNGPKRGKNVQNSETNLKLGLPDV